MGNRSYLAVFALGALVLLLSMAAFTVRETDSRSSSASARSCAPTTSPACIFWCRS